MWDVAAPYKTFKQGVQDSETFSKSGLALVLEHTQEIFAPNLREISSAKYYPRGVNVRGFDPVDQPVKSVVVLYSDRGIDWGGLDVGGDLWVGCDGYAFGVMQEVQE